MLRSCHVSIHGNFFDLGGHSLLATQVISRIQKHFRMDLPLRSLFEHPTIGELAGEIEQRMPGTGGLRELGIPRLPQSAEDVPRDFPLSFAQQRLWVLDHLEPNSAAYNIPIALRLSGSLDFEALQTAIHEVVRRHEVLRTEYHAASAEPIQTVLPAKQVPLKVVDLSAVAAGAREDQMRSLAEEEAQKPFDLSRSPVLRASLFSLAELDHVLIVTVHHIACDGWSLSTLLNEIAAFYAAAVRSTPVNLPELPIQYADFASWQRQLLQGDEMGRQLSYWKQQLAGAPAGVELPTDRSRPAVQSFRGAKQTVLIPQAVLERLQDLGRRHGATLFMSLLAGFNVLLFRYSGEQDDQVVGTPIAGRNRPEIEKLIGLFVNTLVLRTDMTGDPTFVDLLLRVKEAAIGAYANQDVPFERLVEELKPQIMFALQNVPREAWELPGLTASAFKIVNTTEKFDLSVNVAEQANGLRATFSYNTDLFEAATISRMMGHFLRLLEEIVDAPERHLSDLQLLSESERQQLLVEFNDTAATLRRDLCIHQFFEAQAVSSPEAIALVCGDERVTYRKLNSRANQLAHYLIQRGVGPEVPVGICVERSADMLVGILGILKAGGAYVPLDSAYPKDRLAAILEDSQATVLLTQRPLSGLLPEHSAQIIYVDSDWTKIATESAENPGASVKPDNLAYILFTSGSTGRPKGVAIEHRSASTFVQWAQTVFKPEEVAGTLFSTSMCFDLSIFEMFVPFSMGGKVILVQNALLLPELSAANQVTLINTVPSAIAELLRTDGIPPSVQVINLAGEALPTSLAQQIYANTKARKLYNLYGPTEDTTYSTYTLVSRRGEVSIGRPISNTQAYVLDKKCRPVPIGVFGELHLAGDGLARGYFKRPDLTAERFSPNSFTADPSARMYRTGDLVRYLPSGDIQYHGRIDNQVKIRGFRIELGEIEVVLLRHPSVKSAVVVARENQGDKRLVAYVVPEVGEKLSSGEIKAHLRETLPEYMVPSAFVTMEALPLTPNGKLDRRALPAPPQENPDRDEEYLRVRTPIEEVIAGIWAEVLKLENVGSSDDFFDLGGHSLLATQVVSRIRQVFQVELSVRSLFESPTVASLAQRIGEHLREKQGVSTPAMKRIPRDRRLPLSFAQQRLWFLDQLDPNATTYNMSWTVRISGALDVRAFERTLNEILHRHEVLRTAFQMVDDEPLQVIAPSISISLPLIDLTNLPGPDRLPATQHLAKEDVQRPFNLSEAPILRVQLVKLDEFDHVIILTTHHILFDRWSFSVFTKELAALYEASVADQPSSLPELTIQYVDYAVWQRQCLSGGILEQQLAYWRRQLQGAPDVLEIPTDHPRTAPVNQWANLHHQSLSEELGQEVKKMARSENATLFMVLIAGFNVLLAQYSQREDIMVGTDLANRTQVATETLIGFFVNLLPIRSKVNPHETFRSFLKSVRDTTLDAYAHQDVPFEKLVQELRPQRNRSHTPLVQILFVMQNTPKLTTEFGGLTLKALPVGIKSRFDLALFANADKQPQITWTFNPALFELSTIRRLADLYQRLLAEALGHPDERLSTLMDRVAKAEQERLATGEKQARDQDLEMLNKIRQKRRTPIKV
ncbi:MAG: non-ribosomal peptide synthetase [Acidobacteria bacterium]|nr:MAG: non-ribosomal peptide synthetase [Acidobacteriota bacterium]